MSTEDYNDLFRDKFDSRKFEINEDNWPKLSAELDKLEKKRKKRFVFFFLFGGIAFISTLFIVFYTSIGQNTVLTETAQPKAEISNHEKTFHELNLSDAQNTEAKNQNKIQKTEIASGENKNTETTITTNANYQDPGRSEISMKKSVVTKNSTNKSSGNEEGYNRNTEGKTEIVLSKKNKTEKSAQNLNEKETPADTKTKEEKAISDNNPTTSNETTVKPEHTIQTMLTDTLRAKQDSLIASAKQDSLSPAVTTTTASTSKKDSLEKKQKRTEVFIAAYLAFTPGYGEAASINESFNPSVGIGIRHFFKDKIGIGTGLYYTMYGNISNTPRIFSSTTQDFGYASERTEIRHSKLHYIKLPITFELHLKKNIISAGAELMYLITSSAQIKNYNESFGSITDTRSSKAYGYTTGFSNYDINAVLSYTRILNRRIRLVMLTNAGFIDVKNNSYFNSTLFERNMSVQAGINYNF